MEKKEAQVRNRSSEAADPGYFIVTHCAGTGHILEGGYKVSVVISLLPIHFKGSFFLELLKYA